MEKNMNNRKFKIGEEAYIVSFNEILHPYIKEANISLVKVRVIENLRDRYVNVEQTLKYGFVKESFHPRVKITTKQKKKKGILVPFDKEEYVNIEWRYSESVLLTREESKMKMIQYIANDFNEDVCIGCTHGQDESF